MAVRLNELKVKLFTDGADKAQIREMAKQAVAPSRAAE
jgi:hypothetical protein